MSYAYTNIGILFRQGLVKEAEDRVFSAFEAKDFRIAEVAKHLGVKVHTVQSWLNRRSELRKRVREARINKARKELDSAAAK